MSQQSDSLRSQNIALATENEMLLETVNDLELKLKTAKENIKLKQFKQAKIMQIIPNRKRVEQKSLELNNIFSHMDKIDAETETQKSLLHEALSQLEMNIDSDKNVFTTDPSKSGKNREIVAVLLGAD